MKKYPMLLSPISKQIIWGGDRLKNEYSKKADFDNIAESWELSVREKEMCTVSNGKYKGQELGTVLENDRMGMIGTLSEKYDRFPLLIKFIDAATPLSIQVHPDNEYSLINEGELGKTEMWYIIDAEPGAQIVYGLKSGVDEDMFKDAVLDDRTEDVLNFIDVHKGDVFFIPSGQVHAIGAGILIAEIQQNSDITYRVYDYKRKQADGSYRQLHVSKAIDVVKVYDQKNVDKIRFSVKSSGTGKLLASCDYFCTREYSVDTEEMLEASQESFVSLLFIDSSDTAIEYMGRDYKVKKGDSWFIPAGAGAFRIKGNCRFLSTEIH